MDHGGGQFERRNLEVMCIIAKDQDDGKKEKR